MGKTDSGTQPSTGWKVPTLPAWLAEAEKANKWLIPGLLLDEAIVCMSGQKKRARKTMTAFSMGIGLATGTDVGPWKPKAAAPVLICEEEGQRVSTRERLLAICNGMGVDPTSLNNIHFAFHHGVKLDSPKWRKMLVEKIKEVGAKLVILDAIVYMHDGDENKVQDMSRVGDTLRAIRSSGCTVMFLAHLDKTRGEDPKCDPDQQIRGTGLSSDVYDQHIALRRYSRDEPTATMHMLGRDQEERKLSVRWQFESVKDVLVRASMHVEDPRQTFEKKMLECADKLVPDHKYTMALLKDRWALNQSKTKEMVDHLEELRLIEKRDGAWWKLARPANLNPESSSALRSGTTAKAVSVASVEEVEEV